MEGGIDVEAAVIEVNVSSEDELRPDVVLPDLGCDAHVGLDLSRGGIDVEAELRLEVDVAVALEDVLGGEETCAEEGAAGQKVLGILLDGGGRTEEAAETAVAKL